MMKFRVAIVHYWLVNDRGGEKVLRSLLKAYPQADVFTHVFDSAVFRQIERQHRLKTTFINHLPGARKHYQKFLPLMPIALEQLDLRGYDLVISSESGPAKGVLTDPGTLHVCYCHSPMRYLWDMYHDYRESAGRLTRLLMPTITHYLRLWDRLSSDRVDYFIANSSFVASRIRKVYRRDATVIHPPVDIDRFELVSEKQNYFVLLGQLTAYKRPDLAVEAFRRMPSRRLKIIGDGELLESLKHAAPSNVEFLGRASDEELTSALQNARALLFPGVEDFGIVPVEAMACGTPIIAYRSGGVTESVIDDETGLFFDEQSATALIEALSRFDEWEPSIDRAALRKRAEYFAEPLFRERTIEAINAWRSQSTA